MSESFGKWLSRLFISQPEQDLSKLTKLQLEARGREVGIELDRRKTKAHMLQELKSKLN